MIRRLLPACSLLVILPLAAQGPMPADHDLPGDEPDDAVSISVRASPLGNVNFTFFSETSALLDVVPGALRCSWLETKRTQYSVAGTCRGWLTSSAGSSTGKLRLARLVAALESRGAGGVEVNLTATRDDLDVPPGWRDEGAGRHSYLYFTSTGPESLPGDVVIPVAPRPNLLAPILVVLSAPVLLAYLVRRRMSGASAERKMNRIVWTNWILLAIWLYWISAVNPTALADFVLLLAPVNTLMTLVIGVLLYSAPPLLSMGACLAAMAPLLSSSRESFKLLLRRQLVAQASVQIPLSLVLVGAGALMGGSGAAWLTTFSMVAAYVVYRGLAWLSWSMSYSEVTPLESGELFERASALAQKAGVKLARLGMLRTRMPEEANAFATSGDRIILTESLVRGLTPREVNAVIAHELGHHKAGHLRVNAASLLFWVYIAAGPLLGWLLSRFQVPLWILNVPILPLGFVMMQGFVSKQRELTADARAAEITGDPEGKIAALGRLAQLSRVPVEGRGIMQSILSHPSMENRVLALARRNHIPDARALAILRNPDEAYTDSLSNLTFAVEHIIPPEPSARTPVFTLRERAFLVEQLRWFQLLAPMICAAVLGIGLNRLFPVTFVAGYARWGVLLALPLAVPLILVLSLLGETLLEQLFARRIRRKMATIIGPDSHTLFAGIHPGRGVRYTEGFSEWDFGFVALEGDWLVYRGEKTQFAIQRGDVVVVDIVKGPVRWFRSHRVEIVFRGGAFTLSSNFAHPSRSSAARVQAWLTSWLACGRADGDEARAGTDAPAPPPLLPKLPGISTGRIAPLWSTVKNTLKIWAAAPLFFFTGLGVPFGIVLVLAGAPLVVFLRALPAILWPLRRIGDVAENAQPAGVAVLR